MGCWILHPMGISPTPVEDPSLLSSPPTKFASASKLRSGVVYRKPQFLTHRWLCAPNPQPRPLRLAASAAGPPDEEEAEEAPVQELRVPEAWLTPSNALQEQKQKKRTWSVEVLYKTRDKKTCRKKGNRNIKDGEGKGRSDGVLTTLSVWSSPSSLSPSSRSCSPSSTTTPEMSTRSSVSPLLPSVQQWQRQNPPQPPLIA